MNSLVQDMEYLLDGEISFDNDISVHQWNQNKRYKKLQITNHSVLELWTREIVVETSGNSLYLNETVITMVWKHFF